MISLTRVWLVLALLSVILGNAQAQTIAQISGPTNAPEAARVQRETIPFFGAMRKPDRPDLGAMRTIRFLTDDDYPPFHFYGPDGQLTGFNIDLARAICRELEMACTLQPRRWDTLLTALSDDQGDAVIASLKPGAKELAGYSFSMPYYRTPARFVALRKAADAFAPEGEGLEAARLEGRTIGVLTGSAHAAYLAEFFAKSAHRLVADLAEAQRLLLKGEVDLLFVDGVSIVPWLNTGEGTCCRFVGGPFHEARYFGDGVTIALRKDANALRRAIDYALYRISETGQYHALMLKYFPVRFQ
jgi:polar amino acid transport system substrate-binding protein